MIKFKLMNFETIVDDKIFPFKLPQLKFSMYFGNDPTKWLNLVYQFFEYQSTIEKEEREIIWANLSANMEEETREELEDDVAKGQCY